MRCVSLTQGTMGLVRQALERCGRGRAVALGFEGRGWRWYRSPAAGPGDMQHDKEPEDCQQSELVVKKG